MGFFDGFPDGGLVLLARFSQTVRIELPSEAVYRRIKFVDRHKVDQAIMGSTKSLYVHFNRMMCVRRSTNKKRQYSAHSLAAMLGDPERIECRSNRRRKQRLQRASGFMENSPSFVPGWIRTARSTNGINHWSAESLRKLRVLAEAGAPLGEIAVTLGRTPSAIRNKATMHGISLRHSGRSVNGK